MALAITGITYEELGKSKTLERAGIVTKARQVISSVNLGASTYAELYYFSKEVAVNEAVKALNEEQKDYNFDKQPSVIINGKFSHSNRLNEVEPLTGSIDFVSKANLGESFLMIWDIMSDYARVRTGRYRDSIWLVKNRTNVIAKSRQELESWIKNSGGVKQRDVFSFVFTAPYAYMLELEGLSKGRSSKKLKENKPKEGKTFTERDIRRVSNGAVVLSSRAVRRQLKGNVFVKPSIITGGEIGLTSPARGSGRGRIRQRGKNVGKPYIYPCLNIWIPVDNALIQ